MRYTVEAYLLGNTCYRPGGQEPPPLALLNPVILQVCHRCHAKHLKHAFGQIVGIVIQRFLNHRIGKIIHVMFADV